MRHILCTNETLKNSMYEPRLTITACISLSYDAKLENDKGTNENFIYGCVCL